MANRVREDERNERIIRNLLKLPDNRRCINCNSLGPQYVCTNFSTFVCTTCSGIHREFTHRVKSVSMAKFTPQEVSALQGGGNASAREIYLREWDPQRNSPPDGSNVDRLRDFIKHVYVDRRYTGERNMDKPPRAKMAETEDFSGNRRSDSYQGGSRSPPYDDSFEHRQSDRPSPGRRSPGYDEDSRQNSTYKSPARAEVVNDWRREDRFGNGRRSEGRGSDGSSKFEVGSPDSQSPPVVRPVRDILGENVAPLRVIEPPKTAGTRSTDGSRTQRTTSSSSIASSDLNTPEIKVEASFIDFDSVPEPTVTAPVNSQVPADASSVQLTVSSGNDWANFDSVPQEKAYTAAVNSVESVLSGLSITTPTTNPAALGSSLGSNVAPSVNPSGGPPPTASFVPPSQPAATIEGNLLANTTAPAGGQWPNVNHQLHSLMPGGTGQPVTQQAWNPLSLNSQRPATGQLDASSVAKGGQSEKTNAMGAPFGVSTESSNDSNSGGRKALPEDLFTVNYSYAPPPVPGWYPGSPYVAGYPMQYNMQMAIPSFQPVRSTNPFDVGHEASPVQTASFPSVAPLQDSLPRTANLSGHVRTSSLGTPPSHAMLGQMPSYPPTISQSSSAGFLGQEIIRGMAPRPQGSSGFSLDQSIFVPQNPNTQLSGFHPTYPTTSNFSSSSGNPFG